MRRRESALRVLFPGATPAEAIGPTLRATGEPARTIVGIVSDVRSAHAATPIPSLYLPLSATGFRIAEFAARVSAAGPLRASTVWARLRETGVAGSSVTVRDVEQDLHRSLADQRFRAVLFSRCLAAGSPRHASRCGNDPARTLTAFDAIAGTYRGAAVPRRRSPTPRLSRTRVRPTRSSRSVPGGRHRGVPPRKPAHSPNAAGIAPVMALHWRCGRRALSRLNHAACH